MRISITRASAARTRRQWRVDCVKDPKDFDEEAKVRAYYAGVFPPDWNGGYDVDRYPHYGDRWLTSGQPWFDRLLQLGAYDLAAAEEHSSAPSERDRRSARLGPWGTSERKVPLRPLRSTVAGREDPSTGGPRAHKRIG